ncbi:MAG TPA: hypothetical protein VNN10_11620 [Dehalococcoidia bacterium]|nr:hypothetical protein [Dehalococcoidia bacterium]
MPDISVEEAVDQTCRALMAGDVMKVMSDFTPEALAAVMASAAGITAVPSLIGYEVRTHDVNGDDHDFTISFRTSEGEVTAKATWREVEGAWKIAALTVAGL